MPYKLKDEIPSPRANTVELADFIEIECLKREDLKISFLDIVKSIDVADDYQEDEIDDNGLVRDNIEEKRIEEAFNEIEQRKENCRGNYPFSVVGNLIKADGRVSLNNLFYIYFLLATRLTMGGRLAEKVFENVDGTLLFEEICEKILISFWGNRSQSILFGTSATGGFEGKVQRLISNLNEGNAYKNRNPHTPDANDDNLDVVIWKGFSDKRYSQLIGFAQCKTGDSWRADIRQLNPGVFVSNWFSDDTCIEPISIFMVSDIVRDDYFTIFNGLLFFDRCRIMDYLIDNMGESIVEKTKNWVLSASQKYSLFVESLIDFQLR